MAVSILGTNHARRDAPCEDAIILTGHGEAVIAVVADGVGSELAAKSGEGARLAVQLASSAIARGLAAGLDATQAVAEAFSHVHNTLVRRTEEEGAFWALYACTLAAAVIEGTSITTGHIGDSCAFHFDGSRLTRVATAPVSEAPMIILHPGWRDDFTTQVVNKPYVKAYVLTSDGAGNFFLGRETDDARLTNPNITAMLLDHIRQNPDAFGVLAGFNALLQAKDYDSGDDRTMFWAIKKDAGP